MNLNTQIRAEKRSIKRSVSNVNKILVNDPLLKAQFNSVIKKHKNAGHFMGATDETPWYKSGFATDLFDLTKNVVASKTIGKEQRKTLQLELEQIEAKNRSLDKQLTLQKSLQGAKVYGGSFMDELFDSPVKIAAMAGLAGLFIYMRRK